MIFDLDEIELPNSDYVDIDDGDDIDDIDDIDDDDDIDDVDDDDVDDDDDIDDDDDSNSESGTQARGLRGIYHPPFVGNKYKCTVGGCLCRRYEAKSAFDSDCKYCDHSKSEHIL